MTLTLLHKRIKFAENMSIEILASKFLVVMGTYRRLSHTVLRSIVSCVRISEQDVWCWWVVTYRHWVTFNNCVLKAGVIKWHVKLHVGPMFFLRFYVFFQNPKTWLFTFFELLYTFSRILGDGSARWRRLACSFVGLGPRGRDYAGGKSAHAV